jgi:hypothetical protein
VQVTCRLSLPSLVLRCCNGIQKLIMELRREVNTTTDNLQRVKAEVIITNDRLADSQRWIGLQCINSI